MRDKVDLTPFKQLAWSTSSLWEHEVKGDPAEGLRALAFGRLCSVFDEWCYADEWRMAFGPVEYLAVKQMEKGKDIEWEESWEWRGEAGPVHEKEREGMVRILQRWESAIAGKNRMAEKRIYQEILKAIDEGRGKMWAERRKGIRLVYFMTNITSEKGERQKWVVVYIRR